MCLFVCLFVRLFFHNLNANDGRVCSLSVSVLGPSVCSASCDGGRESLIFGTTLPFVEQNNKLAHNVALHVLDFVMRPNAMLLQASVLS